MKRAILRRACAMLLACCGLAAPPAQGAEARAPLWEVGFGGGLLAFADYRGADTGQVYALPVPYVLYRGRYLQADRDGVHGLILRERRAELKLSFGATTPVRPSAGQARLGMPGLSPTIEAGPSLEFKLWRSADQHARLDLRLPATLSFTAEAHPRTVGWQFAPRLNLDLPDVGSHAGWNLGLLAGPLYGGRSYHDYFYGVAPAYATVSRAAYVARGGYAGAQALIALTKRYPRYWVGVFARHDWLQGAVFADSPLVRTRSYWMAGAGIAWLIGQSSRQVMVPEEWLP